MCDAELCCDKITNVLPSALMTDEPNVSNHDVLYCYILHHSYAATLLTRALLIHIHCPSCLNSFVKNHIEIFCHMHYVICL